MSRLSITSIPYRFRLPFGMKSLLLVGIGVLLGTGLSFFWEPPANTNGSSEIRESGYRLINPLLACESPYESNEPIKIRPLETKVEAYIKSVRDSGIASEVSIYFRDLNNGPWFGINENMQFSPSSMLKVPIAMAAYLAAERNPDIWEEVVSIPAETDTNGDDGQYYEPSQYVMPGQSYTLRELMEHMIIYSDNYASNLMFEVVEPAIIDSVYHDMGIEVTNVGPTENFLTVKEYAGIFRMLYNATYLRREDSEGLLSILTKTEFRDGLSRVLPTDTVVAHKFGEKRIEIEGADVDTQLHDCGIVYHPASPYLLCIMTRGSNFFDLSATISEISAITYEQWLD